MSNAKLTPQQWDGLGRFQRILSHELDVEWELKILHYDRSAPSVYVTLLMPSRLHFQDRDKVVEEAFERAEVPGYEYDGTGVDMKCTGDVRRRDIVFYPVQSQKSEGS